jgi:hypothetical protein
MGAQKSPFSAILSPNGYDDTPLRNATINREMIRRGAARAGNLALALLIFFVCWTALAAYLDRKSCPTPGK